MAVKKGYKQTEVGVIPEDWEVKNLQELCWFQEGPGLRNWQFTSSGMKVINVTNLEDGVLNLERTDRHISMSEFSRMYRHFAIDALDIVMASSGNTYSKTAVVRTQDLPLVMNTSVIRFKPTKFCTYGYLWALLRSPSFKEQIDLMITGGAQPNFGPYHLRRVIFPFPTLLEQEAIAGALSDADAWIESLEQLIAKKRQIKQGAMQELLTGKRRLPGFSGKWETKRLGDFLVSHPQYGINAAAVPYSDKLPVYIRITDITEYGQYAPNPRVCVQASDVSGYFLADGDLVVARTGASVGKSYRYRIADGPLVFAGFLIRIRPNAQQLNPRFLEGYVACEKYWNWVRLMSMRSGQPGINGNEYAQLPIVLPSIAEQTAIATVLSDMDTEIESLESKLAKAREVKQGMMQELLTGRIRLIEN
jgi:type I restriction enzyme S subunit